MYSAYKLNKQGDNIQPWCTPFPIWNQSVVPCPVLTVASWPEYRFLKREVRWSGMPISFRIFHSLFFHSLLWSTVKGFGVVNKAEIDVSLELSSFSDDPAHVGSLISGSSAISKTSLNICRFRAHALLKPSLGIWGNPKVVWLFPGCFSLISTSPPFPVSSCLNLRFQTWGSHGGWILFPNKKQGTQTSLCAQEPLRVLRGFNVKKTDLKVKETGT